MSRSLPKKHNPHILADASPTYDDLLSRRRLGKTNLSVKPGQIGTSNATKPENLGLFEYAHLRAPLPKDLKGSEIFPSHNSAQHPETYFLMRRSKDGFVSATGMFKIAFPWAKTDEEKAERDYLKSREYTSQEEVAGNVWISPLFALELSREYKMYDWVRALLDPTDIVQSPSSAKKHITPPPKFEFPEEDSTPSQRSRSRRSVSPSKKSSTSPRKSRQNRPVKDVLSTPSTTAANNSLQEALATTVSLETDEPNGVIETVEQIEVKTSGSPEKKTRGRKSKKAVAEAEAEAEVEEEVKEKEVKKEEKKSEKKKKKDTKEKEAEQQDVTSADPTDKDVTTAQTTVSLDVPISLPEVPSAAETQEMIAKAQEMVEDAIKNQATDGLSLVTGTKKRKPTDEDDEETAAEAAQRTKKAKVLEEKLKRERVRNRALFGVSAAFALAASIPYFF
ncbi:uncharacterized protein N7469_001130 [Penicillium citrinum]|jgi:hypothetical protein|uniref:Cell pattern formation-associated protein stuA n=2 Tax=Penicillium TaxID=5073 RepID=A0A9W9PGY9_PENCI|nr:uncharacterized protein N7469_001130 [Penicillium citrinum]KAJ5242803.1 hypothetical protein N7469_001130 [Penicillium citrinum]KAJ5599686.1 hypothetical protein N7450_000753 [Penicillium hetheringtonii]